MLDAVIRALKSPKPYKVKMLKVTGSKELVSYLRAALRAFFDLQELSEGEFPCFYDYCAYCYWLWQ